MQSVSKWRPKNVNASNATIIKIQFLGYCQLKMSRAFMTVRILGRTVQPQKIQVTGLDPGNRSGRESDSFLLVLVFSHGLHVQLNFDSSGRIH